MGFVRGGLGVVRGRECAHWKKKNCGRSLNRSCVPSLDVCRVTWKTIGG